MTTHVPDPDVLEQHETLMRAAEERFVALAWDFRKRFDGRFCGICGQIGFRLMQMALLEQMLGQDELEPEERQMISTQMARHVALPMPKHADGDSTKPHEAVSQ